MLSCLGDCVHMQTYTWEIQWVMLLVTAKRLKLIILFMHTLMQYCTVLCDTHRYLCLHTL